MAVHEIYESITNSYFDRMFGGDVEKKAISYQQELERYVPVEHLDDIVAAISSYGIECSEAGFKNGFRVAWELFEEMKGAQNHE